MVRTLAATLSEFASTGVLAGFGVRQTRRAAARLGPAVKAPDPCPSRYAQAGVEPPLEEVLDDPVVQMVMRADRLDGNDLRTALTAGHR